MLGSSRVEHLVGTCQFKAFNTLKTVVGTKRIVKVYHHRVSLNLHVFIRRAFADDGRKTIGLIQCQESQTLANLLLLGRMYLSALVWEYAVVGAYQSTIGYHLRSFKLLFLQQGIPRSLLVATVKRCNLNEIEGNVT